MQARGCFSPFWAVPLRSAAAGETAVNSHGRDAAGLSSVIDPKIRDRSQELRACSCEKPVPTFSRKAQAEAG